eukprot:gene45646-biopygen38847
MNHGLAAEETRGDDLHPCLVFGRALGHNPSTRKNGHRRAKIGDIFHDMGGEDHHHLIANRGEIACRIIRTARAMGVRTIAVYSDADAKALHVRQADEAVHIGPSPARESYLVGEKIIATAKATGAEAIHPGYGFLSENGDFADAVVAAGLIFIGPSGDAIRLLGDKVAARAVAEKAGVPTVPGSDGRISSLTEALAVTERTGFPVMIKAAAGGGGRGIRIVNDPAELETQFPQASAEALASFGDGGLYLEKVITRARHVE